MTDEFDTSMKKMLHRWDDALWEPLLSFASCEALMEWASNEYSKETRQLLDKYFPT